MGTVYLARSPGGADVALKIIRSSLAADPEFRARFRDEVDAARRVAPFCTAQVLDADPDARSPYLVTEYIDGVRLDEEIEASGPLSLSTLQGVAIGVASALTAIHRAGIVHRDLKPSNVMLSFSGPRVIDFGIARALDAAQGRTQTGFVLGSVGWMAPEQMDGALPLGPAVDVFAWGLVVGYAAIGGHPYGEGTYQQMAEKILHGRPDLQDIPTDLAPVVRAALARDPRARPSSERLLFMLLGNDLPAGGEARATTTTAAATALNGTWPSGRGAAAAAAAANRRPEPTRIARTSEQRNWWEDPATPSPPRGADDFAAPNRRRRRGGFVEYEDQQPPPRPTPRVPAAPPPPAPAPPARPAADRRPAPAPYPARPAQPYQPAQPHQPAQPYRPAQPEPRRRRRLRLRIPFKRTIIFVLLVLLLLSAADQIASMVDAQRTRLWDKATTSVQNGFNDDVDKWWNQAKDTFTGSSAG
ncbi:serine/threonine protein kinase [Frankia sp. R82]|nr:serine/threonine protein kinase [Frankia sp. R82]